MTCGIICIALNYNIVDAVGGKYKCHTNIFQWHLNFALLGLGNDSDGL